MYDWDQIVMRSVGAVVMLFLITRILGKKQISQLTFFEYIVGITLGELAGFLSTDIDANYVHGIIALMVWFLLPLSLEYFTLKSKLARGWFEGTGTVFIKDGKVLEENLRKERFTGDELMESLRAKNVFRLAEVEFAMLEASGDVSVLLKEEYQPLTPKELDRDRSRQGEPKIVINDGQILDESLAENGLSRGWLKTELEKKDVTVDNVFLGQIDSKNELFVDLYDDHEHSGQTSMNKKEQLQAELEKCQADMNRICGELAPYLLNNKLEGESKCRINPKRK